MDMFDYDLNRPDSPLEVRKHKGKFDGGKALVILGGPSGGNWKKLKDEINPDVIITSNGAIDVPGADYWVLGENMNRAFIHMIRGVVRDAGFLRVFQEHAAKFRFVNWQNWIPNHHKGMTSVGDYFEFHDSNIIRFNRVGYDVARKPFSLREYDQGLLFGWRFKRRKKLGCHTDWRVGTVAIHCVHLAGILGCSEVHTIGYDLCFPEGRNGPHHWYENPCYEPDSFRTEKVFTVQYGLETQWDWIEGAQFVAKLEKVFRQDNLKWQDHSNGLLKAMKVWCS